jgi:hypothetical protein
MTSRHSISDYNQLLLQAKKREEARLLRQLQQKRRVRRLRRLKKRKGDH